MWGYINGGVIEEELHYKIFSVLMCCELAEGGGRGGGVQHNQKRRRPRPLINAVFMSAGQFF